MKVRRNTNGRPIYSTTDRLAVGLLKLIVYLLPFVGLRMLKHWAEFYYPNHVVRLAFLLVTLVYLACVAVLGFTVMPYATMRMLRRRLAAKVKAHYGEDVPDAPMVGFSPGSEMQLYHLATHQDSGLLLLRPGMMTYLGDTMTFELAPRQIENVSTIEQSSWGTKVPRLLIGWREKPHSRLQGFTLEAWDASTLWQSRAAVQTLLQRIEDWRN